MYALHRQGIDEISLITQEPLRIVTQGVSYSALSPSIVEYEGGILYTDPASHCVMLWSKKEGTVECFAGNRAKAGNRDGIVSATEFYQPVGLCVEFGHVVYVCDAQTSCIKIITTLQRTADFLTAIGNIYAAFSVHEKHHAFTTCAIAEAIAKLGECLDHLRKNESSIRQNVLRLPRTLNGPQGNVAAKTTGSVNMLKRGLGQLNEISTEFDYQSLSLLSCMTLDVENFHSAVHHNAPLCTVLQYARNFGNVVKESLKRANHWAAFYYTNPKSWYPVPERASRLATIPLMEAQRPTTISPQDARTMKDWADAYGASVRQCTVRQETTMCRAGTLPDYLYQRPVQPGEPVIIDSLGKESEAENQEGEEEIGGVEVDEYDTSSDEGGNDEVHEEVEEARENSVGTLELEANFLLGTVSRFGRTMRFNNRLFF